MRVIYRKIRHARYLYIKRNVEKLWGARYTLGAHYLSKNTVVVFQTVYPRTIVYVWSEDGLLNLKYVAKNFCVLHIQSNTTIFHPAVQ